MAGIREAFRYGSGATRRSGPAGPFPADIDVMVVGDLDVDAVVDVEAAARERPGVVVNLHRTSAHAWDHPQGNQFLQTVASRPMIPLDLAGAC